MPSPRVARLIPATSSDCSWVSRYLRFSQCSHNFVSAHVFPIWKCSYPSWLVWTQFKFTSFLKLSLIAHCHAVLSSDNTAHIPSYVVQLLVLDRCVIVLNLHVCFFHWTVKSLNSSMAGILFCLFETLAEPGHMEGSVQEWINRMKDDELKLRFSNHPGFLNVLRWTEDKGQL